MKKIVLSLIGFGLVVSASAVDLKNCANCHGANWEKSALGKSKVVAKLSEKEILTALNGYKAGTYGGTMKGLMKVQLIKFEQSDLKEIAKSIKK